MWGNVYVSLGAMTNIKMFNLCYMPYADKEFCKVSSNFFYFAISQLNANTQTFGLLCFIKNNLFLLLREFYFNVVIII